MHPYPVPGSVLSHALPNPLHSFQCLLESEILFSALVTLHCYICTQAFKTEPSRRPIPERPRHGQPPYHGEKDSEQEKYVQKAVQESKPYPLLPASPDKSNQLRERPPMKAYQREQSPQKQNEMTSQSPARERSPDKGRRERSPERSRPPDSPDKRYSYRRSSPEKPYRERSPEKVRPSERSQPPERLYSNRPRTPEWLRNEGYSEQKPVDEDELVSGTPLVIDLFENATCVFLC